MKSTVFLIGIIVLLAIFLRTLYLGDVPAGLHRDEAFLGYNAYSILKTGKDINGTFLPLHLESFLYSPAGYSYFSIPFIKIFGLSPFSVRFASAFFGILTVIVIYFLVKELLPKAKLVAIISAFLIAVSPWHINLSRTATENTIAVFFTILGALLYIFWIKRNKWYYFFGTFLSFGITIFLYQASKALLPFFIPLVILVFLHNREKRKKIAYACIGFSIFVILPLFFILSQKELVLRLRTVSIFATQETALVLEDHILTDGVMNVPVLQARIFHNKIVMYPQQFLQNYFSHFSYSFLFTDKGFPDRYRVPLIGLLYIIELPFLLFGAFKLLQQERKTGLFLFCWMLIVPIGSGLTFDDIPNLQRVLLMSPVFSIITAYGIYAFLRKKNCITVKLLGFSFGIILCYSFSFYLHQYYIHALRYRPWYRQDGYKELIAIVNSLLPKYKKAIITNRESAPTIFFLFYGKYDPGTFQKETKYSILRDFDRVGFAKYEFSEDECPLVSLETKKREKDTIYVNSGLCEDVSNSKKEAEIRRSDGSVAFRIFTAN